jgi:hypothetical protein
MDGIETYKPDAVPPEEIAKAEAAMTEEDAERSSAREKELNFQKADELRIKMTEAIKNNAPRVAEIIRGSYISELRNLVSDSLPEEGAGDSTEAYKPTPEDNYKAWDLMTDSERERSMNRERELRFVKEDKMRAAWVEAVRINSPAIAKFLKNRDNAPGLYDFVEDAIAEAEIGGSVAYPAWRKSGVAEAEAKMTKTEKERSSDREKEFEAEKLDKRKIDMIESVKASADVLADIFKGHLSEIDSRLKEYVDKAMGARMESKDGNPTDEDISKGEQMLTDEEKTLSETREEYFAKEKNDLEKIYTTKWLKENAPYIANRVLKGSPNVDLIAPLVPAFAKRNGPVWLAMENLPGTHNSILNGKGRPRTGRVRVFFEEPGFSAKQGYYPKKYAEKVRRTDAEGGRWQEGSQTRLETELIRTEEFGNYNINLKNLSAGKGVSTFAGQINFSEGVKNQQEELHWKEIGTDGSPLRGDGTVKYVTYSTLFELTPNERAEVETQRQAA